jgi:hypothetical protein
MRKPYSWHKEFYEKSISAMAASVEKIEGDTEGWLAWFEKEHPQLFEKYSQALKDVYSYWGSMNPGDMEQFKGAVKAERALPYGLLLRTSNTAHMQKHRYWLGNRSMKK